MCGKVCGQPNTGSWMMGVTPAAAPLLPVRLLRAMWVKCGRGVGKYGVGPAAALLPPARLLRAVWMKCDQSVGEVLGTCGEGRQLSMVMRVTQAAVPPPFVQWPMPR